jgi:hypothetical protein
LQLEALPGRVSHLALGLLVVTMSLAMALSPRSRCLLALLIFNLSTGSAKILLTRDGKSRFNHDLINPFVIES